MNLNNYKSYKKGMGIKVKIPGDIDKHGKQKIRPGIVLKAYPSHLEVQLFSTTKNESHSYFSLTINEQKQYVRSIYYRTVPWNELVSKWFIKNELIFISTNNPLFIKIAENKVTLLNDKYRLIHRNTFNKDTESNIKNKQIKELINWNQALEEENLKLKSQLDLLKSKNHNHG